MADFDSPCVAINIVRKQNQRQIGAAVQKRVQRQIDEILIQDNDSSEAFKIELFEFIDNDQYSNLDSFLNQLGSVVLYMSDEFQDKSKGDGRKIFNVLSSKSLEAVPIKRSCFIKKPETSSVLLKLVGQSTHATNIAESERPIAYGCLECIQHALRLAHETETHGRYEFSLESLNTFMRLDSAASDAVNLLPKPDHPSQFGSLFGILNRCKTKMGSRLLERWLRQPLLDLAEINKRLDVVESFKGATLARNSIRDGPLKGMPDLDTVLAKMHKQNAGLNEMYRLYLFTRSIPTVISMVDEFIDTLLADGEEASENDISEQRSDADKTKSLRVAEVLREKFLNPLRIIANKFANYERLVEHVVDMTQLPDLRINPKHDSDLQELVEEQGELDSKAERILADARKGWGSFTDIKLESNPQHGFILRTTKADDERELRRVNSNVIILSILKNGVHFTTTALKAAGDRQLEIQSEYKSKQAELVSKAMETAVTYLPVVEAVSALVAELDVLLAFANAAAVSPGEYVRPTMLPQGSGVIELKAARHPCVELMDDVQFLANDYDLRRGVSGFQLITGPNMGGKSTYIRGVGSIVVMAQVGMLVPCEEARISVVDCILARVGAGDAVQKGVSTFMAEMLESSVILQSASRDSLLIIDELGRGTSTFDGYGLAFAISDYIVSQIDCLCLFATHFHELTVLSKQHKGVVNKHVSAHVERNQVVMLYRLEDGPCTQSFGIHVAKTAGFPSEVIAEAKRKAHELERVDHSAFGDDEAKQGREKVQRMQAAMQTFRDLDVEHMEGPEIQTQLQTIFSAAQ